MDSGKPLDIRHIREKYKDRMLQLAFLVSGWSTQPEGQRHGCVIAADGKLIVATGFNGPDRNFEPSGAQRKCGCDWCGEGRLIHAEENAILNLRQVGATARNLVAYVSKRPCVDCQRQLISAGVKAIFWLQDTGTEQSMWTLERDGGGGADPNKQYVHEWAKGGHEARLVPFTGTEGGA